MQARIVPVKEGDLCLLDRLNHLLRDEFDAVLNASQVLDGVEQ